MFLSEPIYLGPIICQIFADVLDDDDSSGYRIAAGLLNADAQLRKLATDSWQRRWGIAVRP